GDTNGVSDVFLRDRAAGTTVRVSVASDGSQANGESDSAAMSADGRFVAFRSAASNLVKGDTNGLPDIFVYEVATGKTERVTVSTGGAQSNGDGRNPAISADGSQAQGASLSASVSDGGRFVAFSSNAANLVPGDTDKHRDVFVRDLAPGGTVTLVSASSSGAASDGDSGGPSISADGRFVAF